MNSLKMERFLMCAIFILSTWSVLMISAMWYCILVEPEVEIESVEVVDTSNFSGYDINVSGATVVGPDMKPIHIVNNPNARVVTYDEVMEFIEQDTTNEIEYDLSTFVCTEFSELTHNNAEERGIRAGLLMVTFEGEKRGHMFNAFPTLDKGIIYVDTQSDAIIQSFCIGQEMNYVDGNKIMNGTIGSIYQFW